MTPPLPHRVEGRGAPLVLLNGGLMTMASWDGIARSLADSFTVIRFDFRGQLCAPGPPPADLEGHAEDLAELLEHLHIPKAHLIGTSFGGEVGLRFAATRPERTSSLVVATVTDFATPEFQAGIRRLRAACDAVAMGDDPYRLWDDMMPSFYSPAWLQRNATELALRREPFAALPPRFFQDLAALLSSIQHLDLRPLLSRIACPTLFIAAGADRVMVPDRHDELAAAVPGARLARVDGAGHALVAEDPATFSDLCRAFLKALPVPS